MNVWRVSIKPDEDINAWAMCKSQAIIMVGWPSNADDSKPQVRRFHRIDAGDYVIAHVPESHKGGPGRISGIGRVTSPCRKVGKADLPQNDRWDGLFRRQCSVEWLCLEENDLRGVIRYWRGTVHLLKPELGREIRKLYGISDR